MGITGCAYAQSQTEDREDGNKKTLERKLTEWEKTEIGMFSIIDTLEEKDFSTFKNEFNDKFHELIEIHEDFEELIVETEDQELKRAAKFCSSEMSKIEEHVGLTYSYYIDYLECIELQRLNDIVADESMNLDIQEARELYIGRKRLYKEKRPKSQNKMLKSGLH